MPGVRRYNVMLGMKKKELIGQLGLVAVGVILSLAVVELVLEKDADRRFTLYNIRRELQKGLPRAEVEAVIARHDAPYIEKHRGDESVVLSVRLGGINMLYLRIDFAEEKLTRARFGGEDHRQDVPKDAPPNIE